MKHGPRPMDIGGTGLKLQASSSKPQAASSKPQAASAKLQAASVKRSDQKNPEPRSTNRQ